MKGKVLKLSVVGKSGLNIKRLILCVIILSGVMAIQLYLYCNFFQDIYAKLEESENSMTNFQWLLEHIVYLIPVASVALFQMIAYSGDDMGGAYSAKHREQAVEAVFVMLFTFLIMLPFVIIKSKTGETPDTEEIQETQSLIDITTMWFAYQFIPFLILIMYHSVKGHSVTRSGEQTDAKSV